jgi:putative SOS response-associated peptidase YedK
MCGRYTNQAEFSDLRVRFQVEQIELFRDWRPTYNVSPAYGPGFEQLIVLGRCDASSGAVRRVLRLARWWLIPAQWRGPLQKLPTTFNARAEEVASKRWFQGPFRSTRCLVPATGWREFRTVRGAKQPFHFHLGGQPFAFAGLWSRWEVDEGVDTFTILTTEPHPLAAQVHPRMPLVLPAELHDAWLDPTAPDPESLLERAVASVRALPLEMYPSDPVGNRPGVEGPEVIARARPEFVQQDLFGPASERQRASGRHRPGPPGRSRP